jgi:tight adherence protein G
MCYSNGLNRQKGHAALLFSMMIPVLFGVFAIGSDGARAIQDKARLSEAEEVASLAISAVDSHSTSIQKKIFTDYIQYFFPSADVLQNSIKITRIVCQPDIENENCVMSHDDTRFIRYEVIGSISQQSWFPGNDAIAGLGETYNVASSSTAKRYQSGAIDVTYVVDHSGSMNCDPGADFDENLCTTSNPTSRYSVVKDIIPLVNKEIKKFDEKNIVTDTNGNELHSQVGYAGFNSWGHIRDPSNSSIICDREFRVFKDGGLGELDYEGTASISNIFNSGDRCRDWGILSGDYRDTFSIYDTANQNMREYKNYYVHGNAEHPTDNFEPILLTSNFDNFDFKFQNFYASGCTNSIQGIIQGARVIEQALKNKTANANQLMIIVSDGTDVAGECHDKYASDSISKTLVVNYDLCENIETHLKEYNVVGQGDVSIRIALIGFAYGGENGVNANEGLTSCVNNDSNIYEASNREELKTAILGLISEEFGRLSNH